MGIQKAVLTLLAEDLPELQVGKRIPLNLKAIDFDSISDLMAMFQIMMICKLLSAQNANMCAQNANMCAQKRRYSMNIRHHTLQNHFQKAKE